MTESLNFNESFLLSEKENKLIGLECVSVPTEENSPMPSFFSFKRDQQMIIVGRQADISLAEWDYSKGLNDKAVVFEYHVYPLSGWTIRSLNGVRRGKKIVLVNDNLIASRSNYVRIFSGDRITLGGFSFVFHTNEREEMIRYEDPLVMMMLLELCLMVYTQRYSVQDLPDYINTQWITKKEKDRFEWKRAYIKDYFDVILHNWNSPLTKGLRIKFKKPDLFRRKSNQINYIRNYLYHPKGERISNRQKISLIDYYLKIKDL